MPLEFSDLIYPLTEKEFLADYLAQDAFLSEGKPTEQFTPIFTGREAQSFIDCASLCYGDDFRFLRAGQTLPAMMADHLIGEDGAWLKNLGKSGWSLNVNRVDAHFRPVRNLAAKLDEKLSRRVQVNTYYTPGGTQTLSKHADSHHVFVFQQEGEKVWKVFSPADELIIETTLKPGMTLYIPIGFPHYAEAVPGSASMHLTIGFQSYGGEVLRRLKQGIHHWQDGALLAMPDVENPAINRAQMLATLEQLKSWFEHEWAPPPPRRDAEMTLTAPIRPEQLTEESRFVCSHGVELHEEDSSGITVVTDRKKIRLKSTLAAAMHFIRSRGEPIRLGEIPVSFPGIKTSLVLLLLGRGILEPADS